VVFPPDRPVRTLGRSLGGSISIRAGGPPDMNRRTADRIRLLTKELLQQHDEKRILALAAELRTELGKHLKQLRDRLAISEIRERRLRNGGTYDFDEMLYPAANTPLADSAKKSNQLSAAAVDPPSVPLVPSPPAHVEPPVQAKEGDPPQGITGGPEIKAT